MSVLVTGSIEIDSQHSDSRISYGSYKISAAKEICIHFVLQDNKGQSVEQKHINLESR